METPQRTTIVMQLEEINGRLRNVNEALSRTAYRLSGPHPEAAEKIKTPISVPETVPQLFDELFSRLAKAEDVIAALESVVGLSSVAAGKQLGNAAPSARAY